MESVIVMELDIEKYRHILKEFDLTPTEEDETIRCVIALMQEQVDLVWDRRVSDADSDLGHSIDVHGIAKVVQIYSEDDRILGLKHEFVEVSYNDEK